MSTTTSTVALKDENTKLVDNPCWGSPEQCNVEFLLSKISKDEAIVYESDEYVVLNKPPDLRMDGEYPATVHKLLTYWYPPRSLSGKDLFQAVSQIHRHNDLADNELRPCHQLDYATSGVLLVARTQGAASYASSQWEDRKVDKRYLAILQGHLTVDATLPRLPVEEIHSTLAQLEKVYRSTRKRPRNNTFQGFQPPHALFNKWRSIKNEKSSKKKRKRSALTEEQWADIFKPVNESVPNSCLEMDWKQLSKSKLDWKQAFQLAADRHNAFLRAALDQERNTEDIPSLPTIFGVQGDDTTIYIFCPLAQAPDDFAMRIPSNMAEQYSHVQNLAGSPDQDYKPSLTKCTIVESADYEGNPMTKVQLWPLTGRRHQLRVHTALLNHPILGDATYATEKRSPPRMCLHAQMLSLDLLGESSKNWKVVTPDPFVIQDGRVQSITP